MNSQIKINSNEGGVFNASNNKVSFTIPEGDHYNLSTSYINLVMSVPITSEVPKNGNDAGTEPPAGIYCPDVKFTDDAGTAQNERLENSALLRSCVLSCERKGNIERIQRADVVTQNLNNFSYNQDEATSTGYERICQEVPIQGFKSSIFVEQIKEGTDVSRNLSRQPVRVKLSDVMNFCKVQQYSTEKYGRTTIDLELNLDKITAVQYLDSNHAEWFGNNSTTYAQGGGNGLNAQNLGTGLTLTAAIGSDMTTIQIAKQTGAGQANNNGVRPFNRLEDSPYWVGQRVLVSGFYGFNADGSGADPATRNAAAGAGADYDFTADANAKTRYIKEIRYNRGEAGAVGMPGSLGQNGSITLVLDQAILPGGALTNGGKIYNLLLRGADCVFAAPQCDYAELVIEKIANPDKSQDAGDIQYTTYTTEEFDTNSVVNFQRQFQMEPEALTMYIMQPHNATAGTILSRQLFASSYRLRIDNKDTSNREIFLRSIDGKSNGNDPLHIYKQKTALMNSNRVLRDLHEKQRALDISTGSLSDAFTVDVMVIGQVLPVTQNPKQVQVNINCVGGGISRLLIAKECMRSI